MTGAPTRRRDRLPVAESDLGPAGAAPGVIRDPERRGERVAGLYRELTPRLLQDLAAAELVPRQPASEAARARREWECFALYACVRGLVAAGGFNRETAAAIDALHQAAFLGWRPEDHAGETLEARRQLISSRYAEYGAIGQAGGRAGAPTVTARLGAAAAGHVSGDDVPPEGLAETIGALHEELAESAAAAARAAE